MDDPFQLSGDAQELEREVAAPFGQVDARRLAIRETIYTWKRR